MASATRENQLSLNSRDRFPAPGSLLRARKNCKETGRVKLKFSEWRCRYVDQLKLGRFPVIYRVQRDVAGVAGGFWTD